MPVALMALNNSASSAASWVSGFVLPSGRVVAFFCHRHAQVGRPADADADNGRRARFSPGADNLFEDETFDAIESTVYEARVGEAVAAWVKTRSHASFKSEQVAAVKATAEQFLGREKGEDPRGLRDELGKLMWEQAGIVRTGPKLEGALSQILALIHSSSKATAAGGRAFNLTWQQTLDLRNLLIAFWSVIECEEC
jgi:hypothetical protein